MFSEYFDPGYFAEGYWTVVGEPGPDNVELRLAGELAGISGRVTLRLQTIAEPPRAGGGGYVRKQDVERMLHHLRPTRIRFRGTLDGIGGRIALRGLYRATLRAELDGVSGRVLIEHRFTADVVAAEDEEWMLWLT